MSAIEDVLKAIGVAVEHVAEAETAIAAAASEVAGGLGQAEALGVVSAIEGLGQASEQIEAALEQIGEVSNSIEQAQVAVQTVAGSP